MKHYTTIEQSKKLLELGLNPESADMYYFLDPTPLGNIYVPSLIFIEKHLKSRMPEYDKGDLPCWSLGALLEAMPCRSSISSRRGFIDNEKLYFCNCIFNDAEPINYDTPIKAAYFTVVYLLENGYIKKKESLKMKQL